MLVWPKFDELFEFHLKGILTITTRQYRILEKNVTSKVLIDRFADFMVSMYRLYDYFPDSKMVGIRIENFRKGFFELQRKLRSEAEREADGLNEYLSFLEQFHSVMVGETGCRGKEFQDEQIRIEKEIGAISDKIVTSYIRDFFPSLQNFIAKYCKEEGAGEEGIFTIQPSIDHKVIDSIIADLSGQPLTSGLHKLTLFCEKQYSGYSLKSLLKKFLGVFMKYYTEIYKYVKSNYPEVASMMLQPHNTMK